MGSASKSRLMMKVNIDQGLGCFAVGYSAMDVLRWSLIVGFLRKITGLCPNLSDIIKGHPQRKRIAMQCVTGKLSKKVPDIEPFKEKRPTPTSGSSFTDLESQYQTCRYISTTTPCEVMRHKSDHIFQHQNDIVLASALTFREYLSSLATRAFTSSTAASVTRVQRDQNNLMHTCWFCGLELPAVRFLEDDIIETPSGGLRIVSRNEILELRVAKKERVYTAR